MFSVRKNIGRMERRLRLCGGGVLLILSVASLFTTGLTPLTILMGLGGIAALGTAWIGY